MPKYAREAAGGSFSAYVQKCVQAPTLFENLDESNQKTPNSKINLYWVCDVQHDKQNYHGGIFITYESH